jgi:syntaxin 5
MLRQSQKVEKSIAQMGELFSQMANLVMAQSETITRIEDDVESGLSETMDAHKNMEQFYEITKGNRSMIVKLFLIMMLVAFVFLFWFR